FSRAFRWFLSIPVPYFAATAAAPVQRRSLQLAILIRLDQFDTVQFAHVNRQEAVIRRAVEDVGESGVPGHLFAQLRRTRGNCLREGLVEAGEQNQKLASGHSQVFSRHAVKWARLVNRVHDRPAQREEDHSVALQLQRVETAQWPSVHLLKAGEERFGLELDDLVAARVGDAELESRYAPVRRDDGAVTEEDFGRRAR